MLEEQAGPLLVLEEVDRGEDARVVERVEVLELPTGRAAGGLTLLGGGVLFQRVEPEPPAHAREGGVLHEEVLVGHTRIPVGVDIGEQLNDPVVAEAPAAAALADAGLLDGLGDPGAGGPVDAPLRAAVPARGEAREGFDDAANGPALRR